MSVPEFGNVKTDAGLQKLNVYLTERSYIIDYSPTKLDAQIFGKLLGSPSSKYPHAARWARHISSYSEKIRAEWPEVKMDKKEEEDFDLFGEETPEEATAAQAMKVNKTTDKPKKVVINKSQLIIEVKPSSLETNLDELEKLVKKIKMDGVEWSVTCKKVPIAFGLMKLQIGCNIIDDLVNTDDILAQIECLGLDEKKAAEKIARRDAGEDEDDEEEESDALVQSAEIVSFNKL